MNAVFRLHHFQVALRRLSDQETEIRIRVGTSGDEAISRQVLDKIKKRL
ncbi:MAG: DUF3568 family protein [Verrucomicrobia bacterium]|nr:DUF3568 family protein [Verrucomicrobiota bacterium]